MHKLRMKERERKKTDEEAIEIMSVRDE